MASKSDKRGRLASDAEAPAAGRYRVARGTQVAHGERLYNEGEEVEATASEALEWIALGYVEEVEAKTKAKG